MEATLVKGLRVIEALAQNPQLNGVSDIARHFGITKSNAHRLLQTLAATGYTVNDDGRYSLTLKVWEIGAAVISRLDVKSVASEYLEQLSHLTGETVHLSVLDGLEVVYIDKVDSPHAIRAYSRVGGRAPAHCVATGKALLACAPDALFQRVTLNLSRYTSTTIVSPTEFKAELARIRESGFAVNRGEWREGVWGLAAPIRDASGQAIAAIGLSGPAERFKPKNIRQFATHVGHFARTISGRLGHQWAETASARVAAP